MAINLAEKYAPTLLKIDTLASVIAGRFNSDFDWDGTRAITVLTPVSQPLNDYKRTGKDRYGVPTEMEDTKQRLELTKEKSYSITVDKGNLKDQLGLKKAGVVVKTQQEEEQTPFWDQDALSVWATKAGTKITIQQLTKDNIVDQFISARKALVNQRVKMNPETCTAYVSATAFECLEKNPSFLGVETLAAKLLTYGTVGKCKSFLVKEVPDDYLPANTPILFTVKKAVVSAKKLQELKLHDNPPGINGILVEARDYGDSFVLDTFSKQVIAINETGTGA